jgi:hypothetical protein
MRRDRATAILRFVLLPVVGVELTDTPGEAVLLKAMGPGSLCSCRRRWRGAARTREARGLGAGVIAAAGCLLRDVQAAVPVGMGASFCLTTGMVTGRVSVDLSSSAHCGPC